MPMPSRRNLASVTSDDRVEKQPQPLAFSDDPTADKTMLTIQYRARTKDWSETPHGVIDRITNWLSGKGIALKIH
jgi:small conductance mechanosensitive channel